MGRPRIAISGPDNVGKTTRIRILARRLAPDFREAGALHDHDDRWPSILATGMAHWWFSGSSAEDLAGVLASSYLLRHAILRADETGLIDRGIPMLEATLAASLTARSGLDDDAALGAAARLLEPFRTDLDAC